MIPVLGFTVALFLTIVMMPLLMRFAPALGLLDQPGARKVHAVAIPRCGGLAIATGFFIAVIFWLPLERQTASIIVAALIIVVFGLQDDRRDINYKWKFFGQIIAVLVLLYGGVLVEHLPFTDLQFTSAWLSYSLSFFFLLGAVNAVNLSDGLDGLAAGTMLLSLCTLAVLAYQSGQGAAALLCLSIVGGLVGFLRYNTHPARVFMGDTGSQFLGLMTASLAIVITQSPQSPYSPLLPLLVLGLPILDTLYVIFIRVHAGRSPFAADKNHIHHQFISMGFLHYEAVAIIYGLQIVLVVATYSLRFQMDWIIWLFYSLFALTLVTGLYLARLTQFSIRPLVDDHGQVDRRNHILRRLDWYYRYSTPVLQLVLATFFLQAFIYVEGITSIEARYCLWVAAGLVLVVLTLWRRPRLASRIVGYLASVTVVYMMAIADVERYSHWYVDGYLIFIVMLLALAIRMTRKVEFRLDTQDMLVLFLVLVIPQLSIGTINEVSLGRFALRLAILLYTCEYLLSKKNLNYRLFWGSAIAGVLFIGWFR